jgi:ubiquitin carboxyl-terminal hydrolase 5/13
MQGNAGAARQDESAIWEEDRRESKYARTIEQLPAERKISSNPEDWKCDFTGVVDNLWLNLSTGTIGSGRQQWDGSTYRGGNGVSLLPWPLHCSCIVTEMWLHWKHNLLSSCSG